MDIFKFNICGSIKYDYVMRKINKKNRYVITI